jgi:hypothetical protein
MCLELHNFLSPHLLVSFYSFNNSILDCLATREQFNRLYILRRTTINLYSTSHELSILNETHSKVTQSIWTSTCKNF